MEHVTYSERLDLLDYIDNWGVRSVVRTLAAILNDPSYRKGDEDIEAGKNDRNIAAALAALEARHDWSWY